MQPGDKLRHFKGGLYEVVALATCCDTLKPLVVYEAKKDGKLWVRALEQFDERITRDGYDGPRFVKTE